MKEGKFMENNGYYSQGMMEEPKGGKGMAIASLVLGIIGLVLFCACGSFVLGPIAIILAIIVLVGKRNGKGMAIAGIITGGLGIILSIVMLLSFKDEMEDILYLYENSEEIVSEYEEDGEIPDFILEYEEKYGKDEFDAEEFMRAYADSYNQGK